MFGKVVAVLMLAAAPVADVQTIEVTLPDYGASYDFKTDLAPLIPFCVASMEAANAGDRDYMERTLEESGADAQAVRRVREICVTFMLGSLWMLREMERQSSDGGAQAAQLNVA